MNLTFTVPGLAPSINSYWKHRRGFSKPYISAEGLAYRKLIDYTVKAEMNKRGLFIATFPLEWMLGVSITVCSPKFFIKPKRKGDDPRPSLTAGDVDNYIKILLDCTSKTLCFNDSQIFELSATKVMSLKEETHFRLWRIE